jgi:Ribbon-Helix-Helix transcriptional regulator family
MKEWRPVSLDLTDRQIRNFESGRSEIPRAVALACWALAVSDSEWITINLSYLDLGRVDLLVQEGFYYNGADFIPLSGPPLTANLNAIVSRSSNQWPAINSSYATKRGQAIGIRR